METNVTQQKKTHWREYFKSDFFAACDLAPGEERTLTIRGVGRKEVPLPNSSKKDLCLVVEFEEKGTQPMVVNVDKSKSITKISGSPHVEDWIGRRIRVYGSTTKLMGEEVDCIRIRPKEPPAQLPELTPESQNWKKAVAKYAAGEIGLEGIRKHYALTDIHAQKLMEEAKNA